MNGEYKPRTLAEAKEQYDELEPYQREEWINDMIIWVKGQKQKVEVMRQEYDRLTPIQRSNLSFDVLCGGAKFFRLTMDESELAQMHEWIQQQQVQLDKQTDISSPKIIVTPGAIADVERIFASMIDSGIISRKTTAKKITDHLFVEGKTQSNIYNSYRTATSKRKSARPSKSRSAVMKQFIIYLINYYDELSQLDDEIDHPEFTPMIEQLNKSREALESVYS